MYICGIFQRSCVAYQQAVEHYRTAISCWHICHMGISPVSAAQIQEDKEKY